MAFATWKLGFMVISWAQLRLDRSLADSMTSSRVNVFGGLAVREKKKIWSEISRSKTNDHMLHDNNNELSKTISGCHVSRLT